VTSSARIVSTEPAKKISEAVKQAGELPLEAWVRPNDDRRGGPARIVSLSSDPAMSGLFPSGPRVVTASTSAFMMTELKAD
jgi:hypothetical protein